MLIGLVLGGIYGGFFTPIEAGAVGLCCASVREAEVLGEAGLPGLLVTTPVVTPSMGVLRTELPLSLYQAAEPIVRIGALDPRARTLQVHVASGREDLDALPVLPSPPLTRTFVLPSP